MYVRRPIGIYRPAHHAAEILAGPGQNNVRVRCDDRTVETSRPIQGQRWTDRVNHQISGNLAEIRDAITGERAGPADVDLGRTGDGQRRPAVDQYRGEVVGSTGQRQVISAGDDQIPRASRERNAVNIAAAIG